MSLIVGPEVVEALGLAASRLNSAASEADRIASWRGRLEKMFPNQMLDCLDDGMTSGHVTVMELIDELTERRIDYAEGDSDKDSICDFLQTVPCAIPAHPCIAIHVG